MANIVNIEPALYSVEARALLEREHSYSEYSGNEDLFTFMSGADVVISRLRYPIDADFIARCLDMKVFVTATTGLDHIDLEVMRAKNIEVLSLRGETEFLSTVSATAELTWGLLLSLIRHIPAAFADVMKGHWERDRFRGKELKGRTLGIIGYGRLGKMVARYGKAFGMSVIAHDPFIQESSVPLVSLECLLGKSDVISIHIPYNSDNDHFFDSAAFQKTKEGALLLNTSRGMIVDEDALLKALESGRLGGAALDVMVGEELSRRNERNWPLSDPLVKYAQENSNLILVPHIGGLTVDSAHATEIFMAKKLNSYLRGKN